MKTAFIAIVAAVCLLSAAGVSSETTQVDSSRVCNTYDQGVRFMDNRENEEALRTFENIVASCNQIDRQAQALLQSGLIHLRVWPREFAKAKSIAQALTASKFLEAPSGPAGYILAGLIELEESRNFDGAVNQFIRVNPEIWPSIDVAAEAQYRHAETLRIAHRTEEALGKFQEVARKYPRPWRSKALIGSASCHLRLGQVAEAMEALQRVRRDAPGSPEASLALKRNTILHRLSLRGAVQPAQGGTPAGPMKFRDGAALALDANGRVHLGYREGVAIVSGEPGRPVPAPTLLGVADSNVSAVGFAPGGFLTLAREHSLTINQKAAVDYWPGIPQRDGKPVMLDLLSFLTDWKGEWLIADRKSEAVHRFSTAGDRHLGPFISNVEARRMIANDIDDIAIVDNRSKAINVYGRDGRPAGAIPRRGTGYQWDSAADIAYDGLGNLYVLDGSKAVVHVFDPQLKFRTTIQLSIKGATPLRKAFALAVDESGRLFVLDRDGQQVLVYQ